MAMYFRFKPAFLPVLLLVVLSTCLLSAQEPAAMGCKELNDRADRLYAKGKFMAACQAAEQAMEQCKQEVGEEHEWYANALINLGTMCVSGKGDYKGALELYERAQIIMEKRLPAGHSDFGALYANRSTVYSYLGDFERAHQNIDIAIETVEKNHLQDSSLYGACLSIKGGLLILQDRLGESLPYLEKSLDNIARTSGKNDLQWLSSALSVAVLRYKQRQFVQAKTLALEILDISRIVFDQEENTMYVLSENMLGTICTQLKQFEEAEKYLLSAVAKVRKNIFIAQVDLSFMLNNLGEVYFNLGQIEKSVSCYEEALKTAEKKKITVHPNFLYFLGNTAQTYLHSGNYEKCLPLAERGWRILNDSLQSKYILPAVALSGTLASAYMLLGMCDQAEAVVQEGLVIADSILPKSHPVLLNLQLTRVQIYLAQGRQKDGALLMEQLFAQGEDRIRQDEDTYYILAHQQTHINILTGRYDSAIRILDRSLQFWAQKRPNRPEHASTLHNLAVAWEKKKNREKAEYYYRKALEWYDGHPAADIDQNITTRLLFSEFLEKQGAIPESYQVLTKADSLLRDKLRRNFPVLSTQGKELLLGAIDSNFSQIRDFAWRFREQYPEAQWMALRNTMLLNGLLQRSAASIRADIETGGNPELAAQFEHWTTLQAQINRELTSPDSLRRFNPVQIDSLQRAADRLEKTLSQQSAGFRAAFATAPYDTLQGALGKKEAAIQFSHYTELEHPGSPAHTWYVAFVIRQGYQHPLMLRLCTQEQLAAKISMRSPYECKQMYGRGPGSLYHLLWKPLEAQLSGIETVYYIPDGLLHQIAFPAIKPDSGQALVGRYELCALGAMTDLIDGHDLPFNSIKTALLTGGLDYAGTPIALLEEPSRGALQSLPFSGVELDSCEDILRRALVFVMSCRKNQAAEALYKSAGRQFAAPDLLHFAIHAKAGSRAWVNPQSPCETPLEQYPLNEVRLYLSGSDPSAPLAARRSAHADDQVLYGSEIAACHFSNTKLAVLSACESGVGDVRGMEGVYGLQRAFRLAGVQRLISSLWSVNDRSGAEFMTALYKNWQARKDGSLRRAFSQTQRDMSRKYAEQGPWYWAMFVLN
ncbi:MAG: tetratricopeptide repeat protein [Saprospirales bacterium]|nr:tetratricopeptide repeat protein [Saprospirales bacterium]